MDKTIQKNIYPKKPYFKEKGNYESSDLEHKTKEIEV